MNEPLNKFQSFCRKIRQFIFPHSTNHDQSLYQKLNIIFGFFFLIPTFGLLYFLITYNLLSDQYVPHFFALFLICSLAGFITLRLVFEKIAAMSNKFTQVLEKEFKSNGIRKGVDEVENISKSFTLFERQLNQTFSQLEKKVSEIAILKELSDLCYVTFDPEELLYVTLERGLRIANADIGSILILENTPQKHFVAKASIGLGEHLGIGDIVDFQSSIAKYAVINKAPFVVENIEKDTRLGRLNKSQYGTKSFVCMPIKTIRDIIGVMTLSRRSDDSIFTAEEVEGLVPLVSNAAFTYENLRLLKEIEHSIHTENVIGRLINTVNSSMRDIELYQNLLKDTLNILPLQGAVLMTNESSSHGDTVSIVDFFSRQNTDIQRGQTYPCKDSILERLFIQGDSTLMENLQEELKNTVEKTLFLSHGGNAGIIHPLMNSGRLIGCFAFIFKTHADALENRELTRKISNLFALAMEKTTLSQSARQRASELATIKQIGSMLASSTFDIEQVLSFTMDMIRVAMKVEAGSLLLIEKDKMDKEDLLRVKTAFNVNIKKTTDFTIKMGQGIAGYVAAKGDCVIENDVQHSNMFFSAIDDVTGFITRSTLCVPMISQGKVIGVIEVLNKTNGNFMADDQQLLQAIASSVSIAIENSRLYKETLLRADQEQGIRQIFQKFVPKEIVNRIVHGAGHEQHLMEELKTVTILNIDLRNFSRLANAIGPQKTVFVLNHFFSVMGEIIFFHKGIVDKYLGDGFLALFGAPLATVSDADNAVCAALEMKKALAAINTELKEKIDAKIIIELSMGISIHTGEVVVGNIGFDKKMDYTVIGDAVNSVFGIQELTKRSPNSILLSEKTMKAMCNSVKVNEIIVPEDAPKVGNIRVFELLSLSRPEGVSLPRDIKLPPSLATTSQEMSLLLQNFPPTQ